NIKHWLGHGVVRSCFHFVFEAADLLINIDDAGVGADADHEPGTRANRIAANVLPTIQVMDKVDQPDGVHVKNRGGIGIVAQLGRVSGDADEVVNAGAE